MNEHEATPILYSFRRCPYAIRARLALAVSCVKVEWREILLRDKPALMLEKSPKGTVPVLDLGADVIDESYDVMLWALAKNDPEGWLDSYDAALIAENDGPFKSALDRFKYYTRHPEGTKDNAADEANRFLETLESRLNSTRFLGGDTRNLTDMAIFPFIRQFANADRAYFDNLPYPALQSWLETHIHAPLFQYVFQKRPVWHVGDAIHYLDGSSLFQSHDFS